MKRMLWLLVSVLLVSTTARADHIGIYSDANGASCKLTVGFSTVAAVIHKFSFGATGSRWRIDTSGLAGTVFAFNTPFTTYGVFDDDLSIGYGACLSNTFTGGIVLGTLVMNATAGQLAIRPAFWTLPNIIYTDCSFGEHPATGGIGYVGHDCPIAVEPATWGKVKSLYR